MDLWNRKGGFCTPCLSLTYSYRSLLRHCAVDNYMGGKFSKWCQYDKPAWRKAVISLFTPSTTIFALIFNIKDCSYTVSLQGKLIQNRPDPRQSGRSCHRQNFFWGRGKSGQWWDAPGASSSLMGGADETWMLQGSGNCTYKKLPGEHEWPGALRTEQTEDGMAVCMAGCAGRVEKFCQIKSLAQLVAITLPEGAWLWYPPGTMVCRLHSPARRQQPRQCFQRNMQLSRPQAVRSARAFHWNEMAVEVIAVWGVTRWVICPAWW